MDSSPKPSPEIEKTATLADDAGRAVSQALQVILPDIATDLASQTTGFVTSYHRVFEGVILLTAFEEPSLKKMGMLVNAFLLRCRELALRWRNFDVSVQYLQKQLSSAEGKRYPTQGWRLWLDRDTLMPPYPEWDMERSVWLQQKCSAMNVGWLGVRILASELRDARREESARRLSLAIQMAQEFRDIAWPALSGEDGLLKGLPKLQEEISGRIYREEFLRDE